jgi:acetolactate synthase-1/2/3 large subunit
MPVTGSGQPFDVEDAVTAGYLPADITVQDPSCCQPAGNGALLKPPQVFVELIRRLPRASRFFIDNSNSVPWSLHYFFHPRPECYHLSIEFATMAWAIGAAIGAAFGDSRSPSVCITGDGCYLMSGQEITVAVERQLPVLFVVLNDQGYGLIRHAHRLLGNEPVDYDIGPVDFAMMARAAGAEAHTIRETKDFDRIDWQALVLRKNPTLLDVLIDPEAMPPLAMV